MNLRVLRPTNGQMMQLIKYNLKGGTDPSSSATTEVIHNHTLPIS